jgi:hypothetical protein
MDKKFKIGKFLASIILPFLLFVIFYAVGMIIHIRLFYSYCNSPVYDESEVTFLCFLALGLFVLQLAICGLLFIRSKNRFVLVGFLVSIFVTILLFHGPIKRRITYKSRMLNLANWQNEFKKADMVGYFINHDMYIGKTYDEIVRDLGEPMKSKTPGKFVYPVGTMWMYEIYVENGTCVDQKLYCFGLANEERRNNYYRENF